MIFNRPISMAGNLRRLVLASILAQGDATIEDAGILVPSVSRVLRFGQPLAVASSGSTRLIVEPA